MDSQTTQEDRAWFNSPVTVQVEQDNQAWMDTMLEMKQEELINYGMFQYGLPQSVAEASNRDEIIQLIVMANKAGGGASVSSQEYIYIKELKGILEPAVSLFNQSDDPLYLVRGQGGARQIYDKVANKWHNLADYKQKHAQKTSEQRQTATQAADDVANHPSFNQQPAASGLPTLQQSIVGLLPKLTRADLVKIAADLKIEDGDNQETYPSNKDLVAKIVEVNEANQKG